MENGLKDILRKKNKTEKSWIPEKIFSDKLENIPDIIRVIYKDKVNVNQIDEIIKFKLKKLNEIERLNRYQVETTEIINTYNMNKEKIYLEHFLDLCEKYIKIERIRNFSSSFTCKGCHQSLDNLKEDREGIIICPVCNCINTYLVPNTYTRDIEKNTFYFDEDINNFIKILDKFEGKSSFILDDNFLQELDNYFVSNSFPTGEEVMEKPLLPNGKKEGTSRKMLWCALETLGYSQYYDEISYIANKYWGWRLPNLTKYKDRIIDDYQKSQNVWNLIKTDYKRSASLGTQFRLYVQLKAVGYPYCEREDFKIQENVESLRLHNEAWKRMCEICNIKYYHVSS